MFEGKFYYSDVNQDLVKELKLYHKLNNPQNFEDKPKEATDLLTGACPADDVPLDLDKSKSNTDIPPTSSLIVTPL